MYKLCALLVIIAVVDKKHVDMISFAEFASGGSLHIDLGVVFSRETQIKPLGIAESPNQRPWRSSKGAVSNLILGERQVAVLVLPQPSRDRLGSHIFGGSSGSEVERAKVPGF